MTNPAAESQHLRTTPPATAAAAAWLLIVLSSVLSLARLMEAEPLQSANDRSRWATVRALVEQGTYRIDDVRRLPGWDTIDLVRHEEHFYSTKPPLLATLVAGLYWSIRHTLGWNLSGGLVATTRLILLIVNILPMTVALVLLLRTVQRKAGSRFTLLFVAAAACFGTLLLPFLCSLNNHTLAAVSVIYALCPAIRIVTEGKREGWRFAAAGFWSAFAFSNELPAAALVASLGGLLFCFAPRRTLLWFAPAALIPVGAFLATNRLVTGDWMPFYTSYGTEKYRFVFEGAPSYWSNPRGIDRNIDSFWTYLLHCTFGHHGLFSLTPLWLLSVVGWIRSLRFVASLSPHWISEQFRHRPMAWFHLQGLALTLIVFGFFLTRTDNYNYGGVSVALRWLLWLTPFWLLALVPALDAVGDRRWLRVAAGACLAVSAFSAWYPYHGPWRQPWLFTLMSDAGWIDYRDPRPQFDRPVRTWVFQLPTAAQLDDAYWVELGGSDVEGRGMGLRLADGGPAEVSGRAARIVEVTTSALSKATTERYWIDTARFDAGSDPSEFLVWPEAPSDESRDAAIVFWRGLPSGASYRAGAGRYLRFPLRRDAFECRQAWAAVRIDADGPDRVRAHRRDAWFCEDVPFGVARIESQVSDAQRQLVARQQLSLVGMGRDLTTAAPQP